MYITTKPIPQDFLSLYYTYYFRIHNYELKSLVTQLSQTSLHVGYPQTSGTQYDAISTYVLRPDGYPAERRMMSIAGTLAPQTIRYIYVYQ